MIANYSWHKWHENRQADTGDAGHETL